MVILSISAGNSPSAANAISRAVRNLNEASRETLQIRAKDNSKFNWKDEGQITERCKESEGESKVPDTRVRGADLFLSRRELPRIHHEVLRHYELIAQALENRDRLRCWTSQWGHLLLLYDEIRKRLTIGI